MHGNSSNGPEAILGRNRFVGGCGGRLYQCGKTLVQDSHPTYFGRTTGPLTITLLIFQVYVCWTDLISHIDVVVPTLGSGNQISVPLSATNPFTASSLALLSAITYVS